MIQGRKAPWLNNLLLLGALVAGTITARMMPEYHEHTGKVTYPSSAAARSESNEEKPRGYSHNHEQTPSLTMARSSS
jgi:hypothetical protein